MTNSEAVSKINDMDISDVENMNDDMTGDFSFAPKGVTGSGLSQEDYDGLLDHMNEVTSSDVFDDMNPSLTNIAIAIKDPC